MNELSPYAYVSISDLMRFYSCSRQTACKRKKEIAESVNKEKISYYDLAIYEGYSIDAVLRFLF